MKILLLFVFIVTNVNAAELYLCDPVKGANAVQCPAPKPKPRVVTKTVVVKEPQKQDQSNEQDQNQHQTVNVYPNYGTVQERIVERVQFVRVRSNNRLNLLAGYGPTGCCLANKKVNGLIGGAGYDRRIVGPFWLGVEVFTNRSYFGKVGIDF